MTRSDAVNEIAQSILILAIESSSFTSFILEGLMVGLKKGDKLSA